MPLRSRLTTLAVLCAASAAASFARPVTLTVDTAAPGKAISPDLVGIFYEDLSYAADGGLYAELVQNRDFEYSSADRPEWHALTAWELVQRDGGRGSLATGSATPLHANTPNHALLAIESSSGQVGLRNEGFDGIALKAGENYDVSLFARRVSGASRPIHVRLESKTGELLAEAALPAPTGSWAKYTARLTAKAADADARLVVLAEGQGRLALDFISLFPEKTFRKRPNGLRADLAQAIADLKPKFMRFPGGCLVHGDGLDNIYHWKDTIGPVEQRKGQPNIWRYRQSVGLGYFEYFQFCEDIGAKPIPVVAAGVCCQNSNARITGWGKGQQGLPMDQMPAYVQDVLDLIEFANGPVTSTWGAKRAAAGHPEPFGLQYLGVGNEDHITPVFRERFKMIYDAVKAKHPEIVVIGTVGPNPEGADYVNGWKIADELRLPMVDEHGYKSPQWLWENLRRYDAYDRSKSKVYLGEWAAFDDRRRPTLRAAISEAAYLTGLERNGDIVTFSSYAPLLAKRGHTNWDPNLIYFTNTEVFPTIGYHVQRLFSVNNGDRYLPTTVSLPTDADTRRTLILGTWNTQAEFDDIRLVRGSETLLTENFDSGASAWKAASGDWERTGGVYRQKGSRQPALSRLEVPVDGSAYTLTLKARKTGGAEGVLIGVGTTPDNYYWWNLGGWGNSRHGVERTTSGARGLVGGNVPGRIETNRWHDIKIESDGQRVRFHLDGKLIHDIDGTLESTAPTFAASTVKDSTSGDIIVKLVNGASTYTPVRVKLAGAKKLPATVEATVLAGSNPTVANDYGSPRTVLPRTVPLPIASDFNYEAPPNSLTVIRIAPETASSAEATRADADPLQWTNPIVLNRADPHVHLHTDGYYYLTASHPQYDRVELRRARTIGGLSTAEPKVIWLKNDSGPLSKHVWAPEIHHLDGKWYAYFTAARVESQWDLRLYVLQNASPNPLEGEWVLKPRIVLPIDTGALDHTVFEHRGVRYLVWSQRPPGAPGSQTYIAKMDTPWSITGEQVCLAKADLPWELRQFHVHEGQSVLIRNGRVFMTYSTNSTDHKYCMGLLTADADADLLEPKSWKKSSVPVLDTDEAAGQWGPGHNSFTTTPDGKTDIIVYHARNYKYDGDDPLNTGDRATRAQVVRWRADGTPDFGTPVPDGRYRAGK